MSSDQRLLQKIKNAVSAEIETSLIDIDPDNPNKMTAKELDALESVMVKYGFAVELWVNKKPNGRYKIIDGEQRFRILLRNKKKLVQCRVFEISEAEAAMLQQIANKLKGTHSPGKDALQYQKIFGAGRLEEFSNFMAENMEHFQSILSNTFNIEFAKPEGDIPDPPKTPTSKLGEIYQLGNHKLICGDATDPEIIKKLFGSKKASQIVTDPPYGVDYSAKNAYLNKLDGGKRIEIPMENDNIINYKKLYEDFLKLAPMEVPNTIHIFMGSNNLHIMRLALEEAGFTWSQYLIWIKNNHVFGRTDYLAKHEFIVYGWKKQA